MDAPTRRVVLFTRPLEPDGQEAAELKERGFDVLELPVLRFEPGPDAGRVRERLRRGPPVEAVALTSRRAAEALAEELREAPLAELPRLAAVGDATAAPLRTLGLEVEVAPEASAQSLAEMLARSLAPESRVVFLKGNLALRTLPDILRACGLEVEEHEVYRTAEAAVDAAPVAELLERRELAAAVFASPSAVGALRQALPPAAWDLLLVRPALAQGATTARALKDAGFQEIVIAGPRSVASCV